MAKRAAAALQQKAENVTAKAAQGKQQQLSQEDMINITACDFREFANFMKATYGQAAFERGYKIVKDNFDLIH